MSLWFDRSKSRYRIRIRRKGHAPVAETLPAGITKGQAEERHRIVSREFFDQAKLGKRASHTLADALNRLIAEALPPKHPENVKSDIRALLPFVDGQALEDLPAVADNYRRSARRQSRRKKPTPEQLAALPPLRSATINRRLAVLRHVGHLAFTEWHWVDRPLTVKLLAEDNERQVYYTTAQVPRLVRKCKLQDTRDMVIIAAYSGLAESKIQNLDPAAQVLTVPDERGRPVKVIDAGTRKNGARIYVPVHPRIRAAITRAPFNRYGMRWLYRDYKRAAAAIGMPHATFHDLRHTAASWLINAGVDLETIADILGHRDIRTTRRYAHLLVGAKRRAIARLK